MPSFIYALLNAIHPCVYGLAVSEQDNRVLPVVDDLLNTLTRRLQRCHGGIKYKIGFIPLHRKNRTLPSPSPSSGKDDRSVTCSLLGFEPAAEEARDLLGCLLV